MTADLLTRARADDCVSDLALDRLLAGELRDVAAQSVRDHVEGCVACTRRCDELRGDRARFSQDVAIEVAARDVARAARGAPRRSMRWIAGGISAAAIAAAIVVLVMPRSERGVRTKGGELRLQVVARHHDGKVERVLAGAALVPGDGIRFELSSSRAGFLGIVGIDAAGAVTPYVPTTGQLAAIARGPDQLIEGSVVLDDTLGAERIVAVVCERALDVRALVAAGQRAAALVAGDPERIGALDLDCDQTSFVIHKPAHE